MEASPSLNSNLCLLPRLNDPYQLAKLFYCLLSFASLFAEILIEKCWSILPVLCTNPGRSYSWHLILQLDPALYFSIITPDLPARCARKLHLLPDDGSP